MRRLLLVARAFCAGREGGFSIVEYGLLLALVALVCVAAISAFGSKINGFFTTIFNSI